MAEELQSLLDKIQKEGVAKAQEQAEAIVREARQKARQVVSEAEQNAAAALARADRDGAAFTERSRKALEQAARDVVLSVSNAITETMKRLIHREVAQALSPDTLKKILSEVVGTYFRTATEGERIELLLNPAQQAEVRDYFMARFADAIRKGVEIKGESGIVAGFKVNMAGGNLQHDLTADAIAEALGQLLRPQIAEIVRKAAGPQSP